MCSDLFGHPELFDLELHGTTLAQVHALNADAPSAWMSPGADAFASSANEGADQDAGAACA